MSKTKERVTINIDEEDYPEYKEILKSKLFKNNLHLFTCAVLIGKHVVGVPQKIEKSKQFIRPKDNSRDDNITILKCLAISEFKEVTSLTDEDKIYSYCEGYARTGIGTLYDWYVSPEYDFETKLGQTLLKIFNNTNLEEMNI